MKKYFYTTGFLFFIYIIFLMNYAFNALKAGNDLILKNFTLTGFFFSIIFIAIYTFKSLAYDSKNKTLRKLIGYTHYSGLISFFVLLLSHYLATKNIITEPSFILSRMLGLHQELLVFIFGMLFFILGLFVFKRSNHKILGVCLMLLFINGLYHLVIWHSYVQQKNITQQFYMVAVENDIKIKECSKGISCIKFNDEKQQDEFFLASGLNLSSNLNISIKKYLTAFSNRIKNSKDDTLTLSYGDSVFVFNNDDYAPIGVYNRKNKYLIIDFTTTNLLIQRSQILYYHMIGVSTICWLSILFLLMSTHTFIPYYAKKKLIKMQEVK